MIVRKIIYFVFKRTYGIEIAKHDQKTQFWILNVRFRDVYPEYAFILGERLDPISILEEFESVKKESKSKILSKRRHSFSNHASCDAIWRNRDQKKSPATNPISMAS